MGAVCGSEEKNELSREEKIEKKSHGYFKKFKRKQSRDSDQTKSKISRNKLNNSIFPNEKFQNLTLNKVINEDTEKIQSEIDFRKKERIKFIDIQKYIDMVEKIDKKKKEKTCF